MKAKRAVAKKPRKAKSMRKPARAKVASAAAKPKKGKRPPKARSRAAAPSGFQKLTKSIEKTASSAAHSMGTMAKKAKRSMTRKKAAVMAAVIVPLAAAAVPIIRRMRK